MKYATVSYEPSHTDFVKTRMGKLLHKSELRPDGKKYNGVPLNIHTYEYSQTNSLQLDKKGFDYIVRNTLVESLTDGMELVPWHKIKDYSHTGHYAVAEHNFRTYFQHLNKNCVDISGSTLDIGCGPLGIGCIIDNVLGYDISHYFIKSVRSNGNIAVQGDICNMPFQNNSFENTFLAAPPCKGFTKKVITNIINKMINIARKKTIIISMGSWNTTDNIAQDSIIFRDNNFLAIDTEKAKKGRIKQ